MRYEWEERLIFVVIERERSDEHTSVLACVLRASHGC